MRFLTAILVLFLSLTTLSQEAVKPEKFGFKEIPFGAPKDAFIRVLCVRYGFKMGAASKQKSYAEMKPQELLISDTYCHAKYQLGSEEVDARWYFNKDNKFNEVQFRIEFEKTASQSDVQAKVSAFNKMFEAKYGAAVKMNEVPLSSVGKDAMTSCWEWSRPTAKILTALTADDGKYYAVANIVDAR